MIYYQFDFEIFSWIRFEVIDKFNDYDTTSNFSWIIYRHDMVFVKLCDFIKQSKTTIQCNSNNLKDDRKNNIYIYIYIYIEFISSHDDC